MDIGIASLVLLMAGIVAVAVSARIANHAEEVLGGKVMQVVQVILLTAALAVVCCGTVGGKALPMISARLTGTPTPKPTAVAFAVDMATKTSAPAAAQLVMDILYRQDPS